MKLSTRSTYGMRALLELAQHYGQGTLLLKDIAERQQLPHTYLEQLMVPLRKANIVSATRGARGGYSLSRPPVEITVTEALTALEGPLELVECTGGTACCEPPRACVLCDLWADASRALNDFFAGVTLAELADRQRAKDAESAPMYWI